MKLRLIEDLVTTKMIKLTIQDLLSKYQKKNRITFDLENNDRISEKSIKIGDTKVLCQLWNAGGDWENPVGYFVCQIADGLLCVDGSMRNTEDIFIYIPLQDNNLVRYKKGYVASVNADDEDNYDEQSLWDDLNEYLKDCEKNIKDLY